MDVRFNDIFSHPSNDVFQIVFFPDRIYHAQYLNATRSERYRYNVQEVRSKADITAVKGQVFMDDTFYTNFVRIEYRSARLVEAMRTEGRLRGDAVRARVRFYFDDAERDLTRPQTLNRQDPLIRLYYCPWIDAYQMEMWGTLDVPAGEAHAPDLLTMMGNNGAITRIPQLQPYLDDVRRIREVDLEFVEDNVMMPSGYLLPETATKKDDFYFRNLQVPNSPNPSDDASNTIPKACYTLNFNRGFFIPDARQVPPVRYRNGMMMLDNPDRGDDNVIEMRWLLQDEFGSSLVFFHEVTIPPSTVEGTHQHIGSEELYFITEGSGIAYMGAHDNPALAVKEASGADRYPIVRRHIFGLDPKEVRELPVQKGSVIFTKSGGIHGIRNPSATEPLRFVAFLYQSA
jgi:mannose-6-phosphate isomerase-like protein (cupin superfamily)